MSYVFVREPLNSEECDRIVNACRSFREKLVVWVLLDTGLRVKEFCTLRKEHIHWYAGDARRPLSGGRAPW